MVTYVCLIQFKGQGFAISRTQLPARRATTATSASGRRCWNCKFRSPVMKTEHLRENGANGMSDIEGKATRVGASERGQQTSFNGALGKRHRR